MSLPNVAKGDPHVAAHNAERALINKIQDLSDPTFSTELTTLIASMNTGGSSGTLGVVTADTGEAYKIIGFSDNTVKVIPASVSKPNPPTALAVNVKLSSVTLTWTASTSSGVTYRIYRDGVRIATTKSLSYKDTSIAAGSTYIYKVEAIDGYGQPSTMSSTVSAFVDPALNGPPVVVATTWPSPLPATGMGIIRVCGQDPDAQSLSYALSVDAGSIAPTDDPSIWYYTAGG